MTDRHPLHLCSHPAALALGADSRRAPRASWALVGDLPSVLHDAVRAAVQQAFDAWSAVAGVSGVETADPSRADLLIATGRIDGPYGVLAQTELPGPFPQHMTVDTAERWVVQLGPGVPAQRIDLDRVLTHEVGHFWGLGHDQEPGSVALMNPYYNPVLDHPVAWDVAEMMKRGYGPPKAAPAPPAPPAPPGPGPSPAPAGLPAALIAVNESGEQVGYYLPQG
jgi:hypothetical protein